MSVKQDLIDSERRIAEQRRRMGAKAYDEWVKSRQARYFTWFLSEKEIRELLAKVGYDFVRIDTERFYYLKTHIGKTDWDCIWWVLKDGEMQAVVNIDVDNEYMHEFIEKVEKYLNKKCFFESKKQKTQFKKKSYAIAKELEIIAEPEPIPEYTFPTIFTDTSVLKYALKNSGISAQVKGDNFEFTLDGFNASIYKSGGSNYEFKIVGKCNLEKIHGYFSKIETEYNKIVQYNICENIKSKVAKSPTMYLEQEEVMEDNSVLLTIRV